MESEFVVFALETVEYNHLRHLHFIENELAHIGVVVQKRARVEKGHHLVYNPAFGHGVEKLL